MRRRRIGLASPTRATAGGWKRAGSSGSASRRITARSSSSPHWLSGLCRWVPMASTTSAFAHSSCPSGRVTLRGSRASSTPRPRRKARTGACRRRESSVTSAAASWAPPPATISGRAAPPRRLAAARIASSSSGAGAPGLGGPMGGTGARMPQTSMAHSSAAGPGRPLVMDAMAAATRPRGLGGRVDAGVMIDQAFDDAGLIADFMQMAEHAADRGLRDVPDQRQHRRIGAVGGQERGRRIEQAWSGHHRIGLGAAGGEGGSQRHIGGALLVAAVDGADAVGGFEQGIEQRIIVDAGQRIDGVEAVGDERRHGGLGRGHHKRAARSGRAGNSRAGNGMWTRCGRGGHLPGLSMGTKGGNRARVCRSAAACRDAFGGNYRLGSWPALTSGPLHVPFRATFTGPDHHHASLSLP